MTKAYVDRFWDSPDGLKLHFRDYAARDASSLKKVPVLCMHGLTRNARDFAGLAEHLSATRRVIVPEMRGRGESEYAKDSATYNPLTYVGDVLALLAQEEIESFAAVGTSLGGLMTMLMAAMDSSKIAAAVLNDIGPVVDPAGIDRIREYVGQGRSYPSWMHAARALQDVHGSSHPTFGIDEWLDMAKRGMVVQQNGRIAYDYDMTIAEPFQNDDGAAPPDLWPALEALSGKPLLFVRGALSDILTAETLSEMQNRLPDAQAVTIPDVGHAPLLEEAPALAAIDALLAQIP
ncbi:alpha/beta hydrolase [Pontixanthobacter aestiaquae]|uniref:Alpha/beta fold hydrolase n=1 Tax=Pontixanthobacter aestiaquae TaxID=1509367 RepID=A0A844Z7G8_9SPHN|nr:alpha/beta hydrolase [Pontixanthobacter aestiaquae]MDN3645809.1 alpha/beta hydrolase [Pontixanthobacter aestiaquae]MXO83196.1 alpha/beta fold hydrolase [Pontixanthobacter aestiaquae]